MRPIQPLRDTHPQLSIIRTQAFHEFRVENWKLAPDGSGKIVRPRPEVKLALAVLVLAWWIQRFTGTLWYAGLAVGLWLIVQQVFMGVVHECLVVFPLHGIQLETHRGFKNLVLSSARTFIPFTNLQDVVINEALYGWNVRYYIVAITRPEGQETALKVAYPSLLPHFPILQEVYREIQPYLERNNATENGIH